MSKSVPHIDCPFYEPDGYSCDHHSSKYKVLFGFITIHDECILTLDDERIKLVLLKMDGKEGVNSLLVFRERLI